MKKFSALVMALAMILILAMPLVAVAEGAVTDVPANEVESITTTSEIPTEPFTWQYLATLAGATAATLLIVQFCKVPLDRVWKIPTRVFVYIVSLAILLIATAFTSGLTLENAPLAAMNAFLVALTAYGSYEVTFAKLNK